MKATRIGWRHVAGTAIFLLVAAACGGNAGESTTSTQDDAPAAKPSRAAAVTISQIDKVGKVLVDSAGKTLYSADVEKSGTIKCVESCVKFWLPVQADSVPSSVDGVTGKLTLVTRPDKTKQVALDGRPLYTFSEDRTPGSAAGNGFEDDFGGTHFVWSAAMADGSMPTPKPKSSKGSKGDDGGNDNGGGNYGGSGY